MIKIFALVVLCVFISYASAFRPVAMRASRAVTGVKQHIMTTLSMSTVEETENVKGAVGSKLTNTDLAIEAINKFFPDIDAASVDMVATTGGVNNIVQYLTFADGTKKLLRIYNNGEDTQQVQFEHDVLAKLRAANPSGFSWEYPNYMQYADSGKTFVKLSNGAEACVVDFIEGTLPKLTCCETIGAASGELNTALAGITDKISVECNCDPYYEMWLIHTAITKENFVETMKGPDFDGKLRPFADLMLEETMKITEKCEGEYKALPEQLIHGDLHYDNVLVKDGKCSGLLDFEFALYDWRAMELATCLSKYAGEPEGALGYFDDFMKGFATTGKLNELEARAIPDLINLRILSNVVYFVGRAIAKEDSIESLTSRIENYSTRVKWVQDNESKIVDIIKTRMGL